MIGEANRAIWIRATAQDLLNPKLKALESHLSQDVAPDAVAPASSLLSRGPVVIWLWSKYSFKLPKACPLPKFGCMSPLLYLCPLD